MPFGKLLPREEQYFTLFAQMTSYINDAARTLVEMLAHHDGDYQEYVQRIKSIEHACDDLTHNVSTRLNQSFITPFDREDIYMMSKALDDVVDLIDGAARAVVMYDIHEATEPAKQLAGVIQRMALQLNEVVSILSKPKGVTERLVELHRLENEAPDRENALLDDWPYRQLPVVRGGQSLTQLVEDPVVGPRRDVVLRWALKIEALQLRRASAHEGKAAFVRGVNQFLG